MARCSPSRRNCKQTMATLASDFLGLEVDDTRFVVCTNHNPLSTGTKGQWSNSKGAFKPQSTAGKKNHERLRSWQMQQVVKLEAAKWPEELDQCMKYFMRQSEDVQNLLKRVGYEPDTAVLTAEEETACMA